MILADSFLDALQQHLFTWWGLVVVVVIVSEIGCYAVKWRRNELDAELKRDMLERGMSAEEIKTVLDAGRKK